MKSDNLEILKELNNMRTRFLELYDNSAFGIISIESRQGVHLETPEILSIVKDLYYENGAEFGAIVRKFRPIPPEELTDTDWLYEIEVEYEGIKVFSLVNIREIDRYNLSAYIYFPQIKEYRKALMERSKADE